ncbi:MAG: phosphoribosylamine--glycine ligase [Candidatus Raymondbacteria bacterium RifOxyA12_full_50_37]|uniref:Phosphoribosylamine--glycine ligase n=1 Tax=Candidatus Raymondbacteria bacterium RIFOXYD12_FULL_49_13 TaxID=1817890 RepID=A0A1F7EZK6_UNCRA|nr:MAG: phosphoribosylamine--glycine ligase [Candidatus Raymondbacteria bacterium RifOxyA12_full_50_37]OGJ92677.1 MAG: phosphoribosylamine--glycine ligase [Candidatus Raymondbacteria bacterium RIFOXYA2_FULL_49_16]OGJ93079.1 MAG: phosphoribosylamine--glycine ligase [Candidatus Raymondbacteria bacterium RifOxyC12_full_50_8]OGJ99022.1 MAG: phosphoribosylamine--glycine ligase [Candidatus Raymondbacteria bacterium RIFOXYC2_FULL_50_21]OGJ99390.1 MAG: phosphoribosylamine--glycine ligase [Candidatus Ra
MKVLVIGNGGREHAIAWKLKQSPHISEIHSSPVNVGIASFGTCTSIAVEDTRGLLDYAIKNSIDLTVVGPEVPLSLGLVDAFRAAGKKIFGPTKAAARIESSKAFAKEVMTKYGVPTARYKKFSSEAGIEEYIRSFPTPPVIKADGLAAGKGVTIPETMDQAIHEARAMLKEGKFGPAGASIVIEECMTGPEASIFAITDGNNFKTFASAQDHKRAFDNDQGPNTGGMGAYAPAKIITPALQQEIDEKILRPVIQGMAAEGCPYTGILYAGLMLTPQGPKVIEFNCRFGDPETEVVLPLFNGDLCEAMLASINSTVDKISLPMFQGTAVTVVLASGGYPDAYEKGKVITGLAEAEKAGAIIFHAGTKKQGPDIVTAGGRVLNVVATGPTLNAAITTAYAAAANISFQRKMMRSDIGKKGI